MPPAKRQTDFHPTPTPQLIPSPGGPTTGGSVELPQNVAEPSASETADMLICVGPSDAEVPEASLVDLKGPDQEDIFIKNPTVLIGG
ncbi:MAG: hypothetical protein COX57_08245 [Alphaproteobacteria bacterium CG_4_10_14_0_2_um_filter_63_37]|nr:MAG: hypothetical protein AUJ55_07695 [Proteobacteria bacterium CG1_02_64_396]PJA24446.1 MAG: hypothetical protein COX57_08245 [Alphaproteobacteria bacterium CG_4_10_14_0_2_um_filter_63_37]